jgi:hypothetical protein
MSDQRPWQESNARQLTAALAGLRDRLERFAARQASSAAVGGDSPAPVSAPPKPAPPGKPSPPVALKPVGRAGILQLLNPSPEPASSAVETAPPPPPKEVPPKPLNAEREPAAELPSALEQLAERLNLSAFEKNVLLLCSAMELDTRIGGLCARAQDDPLKAYPTFALALALFDNATWDALSAEAPLRYWRLVDFNPSGSQTLTTCALRADERIVHYLKGLNYLDDRLRSFLLPLDLEAGAAALAPSQGEVVEAILRRWQQAAQTGPLPVVQLTGPDSTSKQLVAYHAAALLHRGLYRLPVEMLPAAPAETEVLARLWQREGRLLPLALYLDAEDIDDRATECARALSRFLSRSDGVFFLGVREVLSRVGRSQAAFDVAKPTNMEQTAAWVRALGDNGAIAAPDLAAQFDLNLNNIEKLVRIAQGETGAAPDMLPAKVWEVCCAAERPRLDALAQRIEPRMTWDDLVLPVTEMNLLRQIAAQVGQRNKVYNDWGFADKLTRGLGISALFSGESGTGKTMAAEVLANGLRLNLYRIDLSAVVNKYIGETEKNLRRLFDAAESGGAILFFDEADALFGKRSEVKDSHDRYANIEINYLLQRLESYRGLAILATNMKSALDPAFLRRLRFVIDFPCPGPGDRRRLWEKVFRQSEAAKELPAPPLDRLDYERLARLTMAGGDIQNVALNATFLAARAGTKVSMALILQAARAEFLKRGRPITEAEFRWTEPVAMIPPPAAKKTEPALP